MRILFVSETYYPHLNGVYYFVCRIAPLLQAKGHEVIVIAPSENKKFTFRQIDGIGVYSIPSLPLLYYPKLRFPIPVLLQSRLSKLIKSIKPDIIHIQDHFILSKAVVRVNEKLRIPLVATNHFMPENLTALFKNKTLKKIIERSMWSRFSYVFNKASTVTTPTETGALLIRPKLKNKVLAISSGINLEEFNPRGNTYKIREKYGLPDKPILLFVGRLDPEKHIEEIVGAVAIATKIIDFNFVIVGKGVNRIALEQLAEKLNIKQKVIFTGFVPDEDLPFIYKLSHCFAIASTAELLSLATLQAMASGLPIIAVEAGALVELVKNNGNGYLYQSGDIRGMATHIINIFSNNSRYNGMSEKSVALSLQHDIKETAMAFEKLYETSCPREIKMWKGGGTQKIVNNVN